MRIGIVIFPDLDKGLNLVKSITQYSLASIKQILPDEKISSDIDMLLISNGFRWVQAFQSESRSITESIIKFAELGKIIIGFGEGFALLCHLGILPGCFRKDDRMAISSIGYFKISNAYSVLTHRIDRNYILKLPILMYGYTYYASTEELVGMRQQKQILFHFCESNGRLTSNANIVSSVDNIAGVSNLEGNVHGLLARPDMSINSIVEDTLDSRIIFQSLLSWNVL